MRISRISFVPLFLIVMASLCFGGDTNLQVKDIITRHLDSIGTPQARSAAKSRSIRASLHFRVVQGTPGNSDGMGMIVSDARRLSIGLKPSDPKYPGEQFVFDGSKAQIGLVGPARRSMLGDFLYSQDAILRDGLLGGSLTTAWALLDVNGRKANLRYDGIKKIDGRDLHELVYIPRKADADLRIHLYFDPETFRHVKTVYDFAVSPGFSHNQLQHGSYSRYKVEEDFADFRVTDGLTLPSKWTLRCTTESSSTLSVEWQTTVTGMMHNNVVD